MITGKNFNDGWIGAGGLISALITSYQLFWFLLNYLIVINIIIIIIIIIIIMNNNE
jgi:hypothetical protein